MSREHTGQPGVRGRSGATGQAGTERRLAGTAILTIGPEASGGGIKGERASEGWLAFVISPLAL